MNLLTSVTRFIEFYVCKGDDQMNREEWLCGFRFRVRQLMNEKNITQRELAYKLYISEAAVSRLLNGNLMPSMKTVINISYALNVSIDRIAYLGGRIN